MRALQVLSALVWKDIRAELRGSRLVISTLALGVLLVFIMGMALNATGSLRPEWQAGLLWVVVFFTTSLSISRHDAKEQELGGWMSVHLAPMDRSLIFYAKWLATWLFVVVAVFGVSVAFFVILGTGVPKVPGQFIWVVLVGTLGLTGVASFVAALAAHSNLRDVLIPLLLFPITIPLFLAVVRLTLQSLDPMLGGGAVWAEVLVGYVVVFALMPWLLYEMMMEV